MILMYKTASCDFLSYFGKKWFIFHTIDWEEWPKLTVHYSLLFITVTCHFKPLQTDLRQDMLLINLSLQSSQHFLHLKRYHNRGLIVFFNFEIVNILVSSVDT